MSPYIKSVLTWLSVIAGLVIFFVLRYALVEGVFSSQTAVIPGACRPIAAGLQGPGSFQIDPAHNAIFVSAINRVSRVPYSDPHDGLYLLKLDNPAAPPVKLAGTPLDFHPDGISFFSGEGGTVLMVIDHKPNGRSMVEFYDVDFSGELPKFSQQSVVQSGAMVSPNDLAAVGQNQFYLTNDHMTRSGLGRFGEDYMLWPHADVLLYNGTGFRIATQRIAMPNGILAKGPFLYVTATNERRVIAFSRQDFTGDITEAGSLSLPARLDNLSADVAGNLIVAGETRPGSAQVFRVRLGPDGIPLGYETIFSDDGHMLKGASAAAVYNGHLFIGSARDSKMLDCEIK